MVRRVIPGLVVLLAGCPLEGDGALTERVDEVAWFDALEVFSDFEVEAAVDPALAGAKTLTVTVTGESNLLERLFAGVHGEGVLSIAVDPNLLSKTTIRPKASLTAPALRSVYAADRAKVTVSGASGSFAAETDELAEVTAQGLTTADAVVTARGSSAVVLAGAGPTLVIDASEAASVDAGAFVADAVTVTVAGTATVVVCTRGAMPTITGEAAQVSVRCAQ